MTIGTTQLPDIRASATVETAACFMLFWDTDRVEVFDDSGRSLGIVTERDVIRSMSKGKPDDTRMEEVLQWYQEDVTDPSRRNPQGPVRSLREPIARDVMTSFDGSEETVLGSVVADPDTPPLFSRD